MKKEINKYENGELTVRFNPIKCIHAENCANGLSEVFRTSIIPWINLDASTDEKIISQIKKCPSGALSFNRKKNKISA
tara:strand:- start:28358 stop:28591 length:234 start_codon:yes stop_codon:yes gene_type:complete